MFEDKKRENQTFVMPGQTGTLELKILKDMFVEILNMVLSSSNNSFLFFIIHEFIVLYSDILALV